MAEAWQDYFETGEKLLWEGVPRKARGFEVASIGLAIFGTPFLFVGLSMTVGALLAFFGYNDGWVDGAGSVFAFFFGLPFLAAGAGLVFGPTYLLRNRHRKVRYALSNRRAYIASTWWGKKMEILPIAEDALIEVQNGDTIHFHTETGLHSDGDKRVTQKGFQNIDDAMHVYKLIRKIQSGDYERFR
jgi:hypothetical protein